MQSGVSANDKLIENLETQLERLVQQLKDLDEFKDDLTEEELLQTKEETADQIKDFSETLDRMIKGDVSLNNKISLMKITIRTAISKSFNTIEMIKLFGEHDVTILENRLIELEQDFKMKRISLDIMEATKTKILNDLLKLGHSISAENLKFLEKYSQNEIKKMEEIVDE